MYTLGHDFRPGADSMPAACVIMGCRRLSSHLVKLGYLEAAPSTNWQLSKPVSKFARTEGYISAPENRSRHQNHHR